jgi:RNA recognition motif-containing protein
MTPNSPTDKRQNTAPNMKSATPSFSERLDSQVSFQQAPTSPATNAASAPSSNVLVNCIPLYASDDDLRARFAPFGTVVSAKVMRHLKSRVGRRANADPRSKGYGFVLMSTHEEALAAVQGAHGQTWGKRPITVQTAQMTPHAGPPPPCNGSRVVAKTDIQDNDCDDDDDEFTDEHGPTPVLGAIRQQSSHLMGESMTFTQSSFTDLAASHHAMSAKSPFGATGESLQVHDKAERTVVVSPIDGSVTIVGLIDIFEGYGVVSSATVSSGRANVSFARRDDAVAAIAGLHGKVVSRIHQRGPVTIAFAAPAFPSAPASRIASPNLGGSTANLGAMAPRVSESPNTLGNSMASTSSRRPAVQARQHHPMPTSASSTPLSFHTSPHWQAMPNAPAMPSAIKSPPTLAGPTMPPAIKSPPGTTRAPRDPYGKSTPIILGPPASAPQATHVCRYCHHGTTVILQNMPVDPHQCHLVIVAMLTRYGHVTGWECWGNGQAVATFPSQVSARCAVEELHRSQYMVDLFDCQTGLSHAQLHGNSRGPTPHAAVAPRPAYH